MFTGGGDHDPASWPVASACRHRSVPYRCQPRAGSTRRPRRRGARPAAIRPWIAPVAAERAAHAPASGRGRRHMAHVFAIGPDAVDPGHGHARERATVQLGHAGVELCRPTLAAGTRPGAPARSTGASPVAAPRRKPSPALRMPWTISNWWPVPGARHGDASRQDRATSGRFTQHTKVTERDHRFACGVGHIMPVMPDSEEPLLRALLRHTQHHCMLHQFIHVQSRARTRARR
jgi:hypothetical protein